MAGRPKGLPKTGGRKAGTPNKLTVGVKDAILKAFNEVGGTSYLKKVAEENPAVFCQLVGKVLPLTLAGDSEQPIKHEFSWAPPP